MVTYASAGLPLWSSSVCVFVCLLQHHELSTLKLHMKTLNKKIKVAHWQDRPQGASALCNPRFSSIFWGFNHAGKVEVEKDEEEKV